jgi:hypothetical protein
LRQAVAVEKLLIFVTEWDKLAIPGQKLRMLHLRRIYNEDFFSGGWWDQKSLDLWTRRIQGDFPLVRILLRPFQKKGNRVPQDEGLVLRSSE